MSRQRRESSRPTVEEAVETLSNIATIDFDQEIAEVDPLNVKNSPSDRAVQSIKGQDAESAVKTVRESFRIILNYLKDFYTREHQVASNPQAIEGIKDIMALVGDVAKKLDKHIALSKQNVESDSLAVTQLKEYKKLQEFYLTRIARKVDENVLSNWIIGLSKQIFAASEINKPLKIHTEDAAKHLFIDLDSVKKDTEYELFFIKKEDGTHFFSPRLIRNMKLVSDFGNYLGEQNDEVLESLDIWRMQVLQLSASNILDSVGAASDQFYHELNLAKEAKDIGQLEKLLSQALIALMLASNTHHLTSDNGVKNCAGYFFDFQRFLRQALNCNEYQRYLAYPPPKSNLRAHASLDMVHVLCESLFLHMRGTRKLQPVILHLLQEAGQKQSLDHGKAWAASQLLTDRLVSDYVAMTKLFKGSSHGPLVKVLTRLEEGAVHAYDPLFQGNTVDYLYSFEMEGKHIENVRIPAPVRQEFIDKPVITQEFKGFLRGLSKKNKTLLLFNLQDRTSWREHARAQLLEELQKNSEFKDTLTVITFAKDTEFYNQLPPYFEDNHAHTFIKLFKEHLGDESCGFSFPGSVKEFISSEFIDGVMEAIHRVFFNSKNVLLRAQRMDFIEIFYLFLQIKILEVVHPDIVSFTCKDAVDTGVAASAQLYLFLNWLNDENFTKEKIEQLYLMLYGPALMNRERTMLPVVFNRMQKAMRVIELVRRDQGWERFSHIIQSEFSAYFKTSWMIDA